MNGPQQKPVKPAAKVAWPVMVVDKVAATKAAVVATKAEAAMAAAVTRVAVAARVVKEAVAAKAQYPSYLR